MITLVVWCTLQAPFLLPLGWRVVRVRGSRVRVERVVRAPYVETFDMVQCPERRVKAKQKRG